MSSQKPRDNQPIENSSTASLAAQRNKWMRQTSSVPNLMCGKDEMLPLTLELLRKIQDGEVGDLNERPVLSSVKSSKTWRQYAYALGPMGLTQNRKGVLRLTAEGSGFLKGQSYSDLASLLADRIRLFAEVLGLLVRSPQTVEEVNTELVESYNLDWKTVANARNRMTWLEVLGLIEWLGERKQGATPAGGALFATWEVVTPAALTVQNVAEAVDIPEPPDEVAALLDRLSATDDAHDSRNTYNIWVPSPRNHPNKIENVRTSIEAAVEPIDKDALMGFIADQFGLKRSSVESMLPFMRAAGLLQEIRRGVFAATPAAKAWLRSGSDLDFIRILHANMRFIGELIRAATTSVPRSDIYRDGVAYGLNKEKVRWLIFFMLESGLLVETSWSSVQATPTGLRFIETIPLAKPPQSQSPTETEPHTTQAGPPRSDDAESNPIVQSLIRTASDPSADGAASGVAFERFIERAFLHMGFQAQRISGPGDTDVLVQWYDSNQSLQAAIVDGKSTSSGRVDHNNVSDVAIDTHKEKHSASFVAIVAPSFVGGTIKNMAERKQWALITAEELGQVVTSADAFGLRPAEIGVMFAAPDGMSRLGDLIDARQRELDVVSLVISRLKVEVETQESLSPRDIWLIERSSQLAPNIDELLDTFSLFERLDSDIVRNVESAQDPRYATYQIGDVQPAAKRLRALAAAIEQGLQSHS